MCIVVKQVGVETALYYNVQCAMYNVQCAMCIVVKQLCTINRYNVQCAMCIVVKQVGVEGNGRWWAPSLLVSGDTASRDVQ